MTFSQALSHMTTEEISDLLVECCGFLEADAVYEALRRGLTGAELDRIHLHLANRAEE